MNNPGNKCPTPNPLESDSEFQMTVMNPNPSFKARRDGDHYFIEWEYSKEEWEWFTDPNIDRTGMVLELTGVVTHRNQKKTLPETKQKGGQLSQEAGKMCGNKKYHLFLMAEYSEIWNRAGYLFNNDNAAAYCTRELCGVLSRAEIDSQPTAKKRFMALMHEFSVWCLERA